MTVNGRISLLIDGLIVATTATSESSEPGCAVPQDTWPAGGDRDKENSPEALSQAGRASSKHLGGDPHADFQIIPAFEQSGKS